jgi:alpha-galactosidase
MFLHFDYYVTESSGHNSEYNPWFRKREDLIEQYCTHGTGWNPGEHAYILKEYLNREENWKKDIDEWLAKDEVDLERGHEYAAYIFNAVFGDGVPYEFNGNVRNFGLVDNLPEGCCVEVPVLASRRGLDPLHVGPLPEQVAPLTALNASCEELAVEGAIAGDEKKVRQAIYMDPLTSAVLGLNEIDDMVDEMFAANREWLPQFE